MNETPYQILPSLSDAEFTELKADIAARGVMIPVEYDEAGHILDGHHRVQACQELGLLDWPRVVRQFVSEADKRTHVRQLNLARRHLTQEQRRALIEEELRDRPERSNRQIATSLGVDDKTVGTARERLESAAEIPHLNKTVGADGKSYPAQRPRLTAIDLGDEANRPLYEAWKAIREKNAETRRSERIEKIVEIAKQSNPLTGLGKFPVIYCDPPWRYEHIETESRAIENQYPTLSLDEICALPVSWSRPALWC